MTDWKEYRLGDIIDEIAMGPFGSNIKVECFVDEGIPVLNGSNLQGFKLEESKFNFVTAEKADTLGRANAFRGDIVITHRGTLGQIVYIPHDSKYDRYIISQSQFRVKFKPEIDPQFIVYFFHSRKGQHILLSNASQVGVPAIARPSTSFKELKATLPPLAKQKKIAGILSALDEKIETNRKINARLEELAQAIFKSWFIDFKPFGGQIPSDWEEGTLSDLLTLKKNPIKASEVGKLPYLPIDSIPIHHLGIEKYDKPENANSSLITFSKNDILIGAMRVYFHRVIISPFEGVTRTTCFVLQSKEKIFLPFSLLLCNQNTTIDYANTTSKGTTMPYAIWENGLGNMEINIPSSEVLEQFYNITMPLIEKIRDGYQELTCLRELRDALLPKLMSGELKPE